MNQDENDFGIRLNVKEDEDFSTPLNIPPGIYEDEYATQTKQFDTFTNRPYSEESVKNNLIDYGYGDYGESYRKYIYQSHGRAIPNTLQVIVCVFLFAITIFIIVNTVTSIRRNDVLAEAINGIDFSMLQVDGPKNEQTSLEESLTPNITMDLIDTSFIDDLSNRISHLESQISVEKGDNDDYAIYTDAASHFLIADQLEKYFATLYCNAWNLKVDLVYTNSQETMDEPNSACVLTPDINGVPGIGEPGGGTSVIVDNNTQEFSALQYAQPGDKLYITTVYGEFIYEVSSTMLGMTYNNGKSIVLENNQDLMDYCVSGAYNGIALCTAYPFDNSEPDSNYCFVVFARLVDGTSMTL